LAVDADKINRGVTKGKAVILLHTWKDHLWAIGSKGEPPEAVSSSAVGGQDTAGVGDEKDGGADSGGVVADAPPGEGQEPVAGHSLDAKDDGPAAGAEETLAPEGNVHSSHRLM
jgi:translation initiation factor 2D